MKTLDLNPKPEALAFSAQHLAGKGKTFSAQQLLPSQHIIVTGNNQIEINCVKKDLKQNFKIKDLGKLKYFLRIEIAHSQKELFISQRKYVLDLLKETDKFGCKPAKTPIETNIKLNIENGEPLKDINHFQRLV
jgi:Reverse transcriptase (RNA-dependent DNA polymerase)